MLPILPALILLLLQGPGNVERMALDGRLPAALQALQRHVDSPQAKQLACEEVVALASLLAVTGDPGFSKAIYAILNSDGEPKAEPRIWLQPEDESPPPCVPRAIGRERDAFYSAQRSRDGPHAR